MRSRIDLHVAAKLRFTAGRKNYLSTRPIVRGESRPSGTFGPAALARGWADLIPQYAVNDAGHGALVGRVGSNTYAQAFLI